MHADAIGELLLGKAARAFLLPKAERSLAPDRLRRAHSVNLTFVTIDEIRELITLANETGVAELEVQRGEDRVRIRRAGFANPQEMAAGLVAGVHVAAPP